MIGEWTEIGPGTVIGDYSYVNMHACIRGVSIGKFTSIGYKASIGLQEHPTTLLSTSPYIYGQNNVLGCSPLYSDHQLPTLIGNDVWIGAGAFIRQGVTVADGAIVAAESVVLHDVPPYAIVAGTPARIVRYRANEETIRRLLVWKWWDLSLPELTKVQALFHSEQWESDVAARGLGILAKDSRTTEFRERA
jgi:acetyltransferase-like isoleucine patch superfamily enzyme